MGVGVAEVAGVDVVLGCGIKLSPPLPPNEPESAVEDVLVAPVLELPVKELPEPLKAAVPVTVGVVDAITELPAWVGIGRL